MGVGSTTTNGSRFGWLMNGNRALYEWSQTLFDDGN
jgi:hypothetical protein